jgi:hypothetical protein
MATNANNGAPAPETPQKGKVEKLLNWAALIALKAGELAVYAKEIVTSDNRLRKAEKAMEDGLQYWGKVVAAMKRNYIAAINDKSIPADTTFKAYFEQNAGGVCPGRVLAIAELFNALCLTNDANGNPLFSETNYDAAAVDWLERSATIVKAAQKKHGDQWKTSQDVQDVIGAMSKPGDALKTLKEVRARQKGEKPETTEKGGTPVAALTVGMALEFLKGAIKNAGNMLAGGKKDETFLLFTETFHLHDSWEMSGVEPKVLRNWTNKIMDAERAAQGTQKNRKPKKETPKPAETPAPATPPPASEPAAAPTPEPAAALAS